MAKIATDIEQSKLLAKILPIESADMIYSAINNSYPWVWKGIPLLHKNDAPAWSLAALLEVLADTIDGENGETYHIRIFKVDGEYMIAYQEEWIDDTFVTEYYEDFVDACVEMIKLLKGRDLL